MIEELKNIDQLNDFILISAKNYNGIDNHGNAYCSRNFDDLDIKTINININPFIF